LALRASAKPVRILTPIPEPRGFGRQPRGNAASAGSWGMGSPGQRESRLFICELHEDPDSIPCDSVQSFDVARTREQGIGPVTDPRSPGREPGDSGHDNHPAVHAA